MKRTRAGFDGGASGAWRGSGDFRPVLTERIESGEHLGYK